MRDVTEEIENELIAKMLEVLEEFRYTQLFPQSGPASDIPDDMRHSKMVSLRICYFAGGIANLYKQWFRGDLDCMLNDIAMEVSKLLHLKAQELFGT